MSWPIDPRFNIFNDPPGMEIGSKGAGGGGGFRETDRAAGNGGGEGRWGSRGHHAERLGAPSYAEVCRREARGQCALSILV